MKGPKGVKTRAQRCAKELLKQSYNPPFDRPSEQVSSSEASAELRSDEKVETKLGELRLQPSR